MRRGWRLGTVLAAGAVLVAGAAQGVAHGAVSPQVNIGGVACPLPDRCQAVGIGWGSSGIGRMLSWSWNGRSWRRLAVPDRLPRGQTSGLGPVSCWSASGCLALGYGGRNGNLSLDEVWNGRRWQPLSQRGSYFGADVSCPAARECVAASGAAAAAAVWRAGRWRAMQVPFPRGTSFPQLTNVACATAGRCLAIGSAYSPPPVGNLIGFADGWNGRSWRLLRVPLPPSALDPADLEGVSCLRSGPCLVVGEYSMDTPAGGTDLAFATRWDGGARLREVRAPQPGSSSGLGFVSCPAASRCVAVGGFDTASSAFGFSAVWHQTGWGTLRVPHPDILGTLWGLSCATPSACLAVGQRAGPDNAVQNYTAVWNGTRWRLVTGGLKARSGGRHHVMAPMTRVQKIKIGGSPAQMAIDGELRVVWAATSSRLVRISEATRKVTARLTIPAGFVAVDPKTRTVWAIDSVRGALVEISEKTKRVIHRYADLPGSPDLAGLATDSRTGRVWVSTFGTLDEISEASRRLVRAIPLHAGNSDVGDEVTIDPARNMIFVDVIPGGPQSSSGWISQINGSTGRLVRNYGFSESVDGDCCVVLAVDSRHGQVWAGDQGDASIISEARHRVVRVLSITPTPGT